jgi:transposase InsO family protein/transposase
MNCHAKQEMMQDAYREIAASCHGAKGRMKEKWAGIFGVSAVTLDRWLKEYSCRESTGRAHEAMSNKAASKEYAETVFAMKQKMGCEKRTLTTTEAIAMCEQQGLIPEGVITVAEANRIARVHGITRKTRTRRMESRIVNETQLTDGSGSEYLYVKKPLPDGDWLLGIRTTKKTSEKNPRLGGEEPGEDEGRLLVYYYGLVEACSRVLYAEVSVARGESAVDHIEFLERAWRVKGDHPLAGMPKRLITDNGPLGRPGYGDSLMRELGVELITHMPYQSQAKGKIERVWRTMWQRFELPFLANKGREIRLSELQAMLTNFLREYNTLPCPNLLYKPMRLTRIEALRRFANEAITLPPSDARFLDLATKETERTVNAACAVTLDNIEYEIIGTPWHLVSQKVGVRRSLSGRVQVRNPQTKQWLDTKQYRYLEDSEYRNFKRDINDELREAAADISPAERFLYEGGERTGAACGETVVDLAGAREAQLASERESRGFNSLTEALGFVADIIGRPVWKLREEFPNEEALIGRIEQYITENIHDRAAIQRFAELLFQKLPARSVAQ